MISQANKNKEKVKKGVDKEEKVGIIERVENQTGALGGGGACGLDDGRVALVRSRTRSAAGSRAGAYCRLGGEAGIGRIPAAGTHGGMADAG